MKISIPTGTIKSVLLIAEVALCMLFQFLLVRLKVSICFDKCFFIQISIPTGTIKREQKQEIINTRVGFQFLLVRLKVREHS